MGRKNSTFKVDGLDSLYNNALKCEVLQRKLPYTPGESPERIGFRVSGSPFCTYKFLFSTYEVIKGNKPWDFAADFFCGIGTSAHSTLQRWIALANPGRILGNWRCLSCCDHPYEHQCIHCNDKCESYTEAVVGPRKCPICGQYMTYEEFQFIFPTVPVSGHCDGVLLDDTSSIIGTELTEDNIYVVDNLLRDTNSNAVVNAYIIEYKTASRNKASMISNPQPEHKAQASMYVYRANEDFPEKFGLKNIKVKGAIVKYISRDLPNIRSADIKFDIDDNGAFYQHNVNVVRRVIKAFKSNDADFLMPSKLPCEGKYKDYYVSCPFMDVCKEFRNFASEMLYDCRKKVLRSWKSFDKNLR